MKGKLWIWGGGCGIDRISIESRAINGQRRGKWTHLDGQNGLWGNSLKMGQGGRTLTRRANIQHGKGEEEGGGLPTWVSSGRSPSPLILRISTKIHSMKSVGLFLLFSSIRLFVFGQSLKNVQLGFPQAWDGDKFPELYCPSKGIPKFLDGFFLCQLSAAYGNPNAPPGQRLSHMIDAIGAIGSFRISNGEVIFSARYYPARPFQIWQFYDRNMSKSSVPWAGWSDYNLTAMSRWEQIPPNPDTARFHPNLDFWRIGQRVIAGTEAPFWIGYQFDVGTLTNFTLAHLIEDNDIFGTPRPNLIPISMAMHERVDLLDGSIWGTFSAMNFDEERFFQGLFTIDPKGVRKIVGMYDFGVWDSRACRAKDDEYIGDKTQLPGYIHSITSTEHFLILPITSLIINPCKFKEPPRTGSSGNREEAAAHIQAGGLWGMDFYDMVPMRFLIFDKRTRSWITQKPLEVFPSMFVTHQLNAFEDLDGNIVADMIVYDSHDPYVKYFYTDFLRSQLYPSTARVLRFTLDIHSFRVMYSYLVPQETLAVDFPQVNHAFDSRPYQWAYLLEHPFAGGNKILKINVNEPTGKRNVEFRPKEDQLVLHEPYFHPKPGASREDDGILLVRALDLEENKGILLVVDATTMEELGRAFCPISIPFGFHNRFFTSRELGIRMGIGRKEGGNAETHWVHSQLRRRPKGPFPGNSDRGFWGRMSGTSPAPSTVHPVSWIPIVPGDENEEQNNGPQNQRQQFGRRIPAGLPIPAPPVSPLLPWAQTPSVTPWWPRPSPSPFDASSTPPSPIPPFVPSARQTSTKEDEGGGPLTVRQLYERTLRALCRWLPRLLKTISYQGCVSGGQKAIRWVQPFAKKLAHSPEEDLANEEDGNGDGAMDEYGRMPNRGWFRPVLRPPPSPNEFGGDQLLAENSGGGGPWYNQRKRGRR